MLALSELTARFVQETQCALGGNLTAIYLHGSAVMDCYNPLKSDVDLIVVVENALCDDEKLDFMRRVVELDRFAPPKGLEISVVRAADCCPVVHPMPYEIHYSRMHTRLWQTDQTAYLRKLHGVDPDLAAHMAVIKARGQVLLGKGIDQTIGTVDRAVYWDSIYCDVCGAEEDIIGNPIYVTLNLCRALAFLKDNTVLSKKEGGQWALERVDDRYHSLIRQALEAYSSDREMSIESGVGRDFARYMLALCEQTLQSESNA